MKLLKLPEQEDPIIHRIDSIKDAVLSDHTGIYLDELMVLCLDYFRQFPADYEYRDIVRAENHLADARNAAYEYFSEFDNVVELPKGEREER